MSILGIKRNTTMNWLLLCRNIRLRSDLNKKIDLTQVDIIITTIEKALSMSPNDTVILTDELINELGEIIEIIVDIPK